MGKQWLGNIGKTDNGVVSVSSLWADEGVYYPLEVEPYTPKHHFEKGKSDPGFRTKLKIARQLVQRSVAEGVPFRAVVADSFYGEDEDFRQALSGLGVGYVLALKESHSWWHKEGTIGALREAALAAGWKNAKEPGWWMKVVRAFRDGHEEEWWALEVQAGPYGPEKAQRAFVVTTDPEKLPRLGTWYLTTNLPAPGSERANKESELLAPAGLAEVVRLYGLRMWVEQSYKQVKHALGWSDYQVRSDPAIRRHWQLVFLAFSFCWWACGEQLELGAPPGIVVLEDDAEVVPAASTTEGRGKKERGAPSKNPAAVMAASAEAGKGVAGALHNGVAILEGVHRQGPARRVESIA